MKEHVIGIDLGTTNSEVAVYVDGKIEIVEENGNPILPSYVGLSADNELLIGEEAKNQYILYPERTVKSIKRKMGTNEEVRLGDKTYLPQDISAMILKKLKSRAENFLNEKVSKAVITVPAQFSDAQRQATREAGEIAGLEVLRIINEPTAASLAFSGNDEKTTSKILVFDLGGGTFDVSLVNMEGELIEVIASHGNNKLGGDDFDKALTDFIITKLKKKNKKIKLTDFSKYRLNRIAENAKIHLSNFTHATIAESNISLRNNKTPLTVNEEISRNEFEDLLEDFLNDTIRAIHKTLADGKVKPSDIDDIVLVGGSTRIPLISDIIEREFNKKPRKDVHPELAVAYGAGVMAARLMGEKHHKILIDITPYTFGTSCVGMLDGEYCSHLFSPVIKSGTPLPVSRENSYYTMMPGQKAVEVNIFQGEDHDARKNTLIGKFRIEGLSEDAPEESEIALKMQLSLDGILKVTAMEVDTGLSKHISIENTLTKLSDEQIKKSQEEIQRLFTEGFEEEYDIGHEDIDVSDEPDDAILDACEYESLDVFKERIQKLKNKMTETDRIEIKELFDKAKKAVADENEDDIEKYVSELDDILFYMEVE